MIRRNQAHLIVDFLAFAQRAVRIHAYNAGIFIHIDTL